jgi:CRISPR/Cas system CSM-associated protein Csm3 (group 7 of RAMP superfamily)
MARQVHTRWKIKATLKALTPIHVGGMGGDADTDLALAMNGCGKYYIPGTSLAGAFRGWMARSLNDDVIKDLWGDHESEQRGASFFVIDDAEIALDNSRPIEIREGVGIDRHTGAAAERFKYNRAILPKGICFPLSITLDCQNKETPTNLWQLLQALEQGHIRIGAAKTRGLGRVALKDLTIHQQNLNDAEGIFNTLLNGGREEDWNAIKAENHYQPPAQLNLEMAWKPRDPVMVKAEGDGIAVDILPLVSQVDSGVRFVIPGSSIKGVLRAHAERIVRTVCQKDTGDKFLEQVHLNLVNEIFGAASRSEKELGLIGAISIDDCYAKLSMSPEHWSAVENAAKENGDEFGQFKEKVRTALKGPSRPFRVLQPAMHVAVDRWTGGAADGMLYSVLEPIGVEWEKIGLQLDVERLKQWDEVQKEKDPNYKEQLQPAIALLLLVLRDFSNRKIPIGYGTNRGMGTVQVNEVILTSSQIHGLEEIEGEHKVADVPDKVNLLGDLLDEKLLEKLTKTWVEWIEASGKEVSQ